MKHWKNKSFLLDGIKRGDRVILARALTLVESNLASDRHLTYSLLHELEIENKCSKRIAISGSPGAGKSTFIESFGMQLARQGKQIAVLTIDPSSQVSKGSILGDKTRMEELSRHPNAFIRPSAAGDVLGGVAKSTYSSILICEAAGFDHIIIETVGVGQSEIAARQLCDFFILILLPGAGDDLQGIKKGIVEIADLIFVNKADGVSMEEAEKTRKAYEGSLKFFQERITGWKVPVVKGSALYRTGLDSVGQWLERFYMQHGDEILRLRVSQQSYWFENWWLEAIKRSIEQDDDLSKTLNKLRGEVLLGQKLPLEASEEFLSVFSQKMPRHKA